MFRYVLPVAPSAGSSRFKSTRHWSYRAAHHPYSADDSAQSSQRSAPPPPAREALKAWRWQHRRPSSFHVFEDTDTPPAPGRPYPLGGPAQRRLSPVLARPLPLVGRIEPPPAAYME